MGEDDEFYRDRYSGREVAEGLNSELSGMAYGFIGEVNSYLSSMDCEVKLAGSLSRGMAIYNKGDRLFIKDIDFQVTKLSSGDWLTKSEADQLRKDSGFFGIVKSFLREVGRFYAVNNIENHINEADFIYNKKFGLPGTFAIGAKSSFVW